MRKTLIFPTVLAGALLTAMPALAAAAYDDQYNGYSGSYSDQYNSDRYDSHQYDRSGERLNDMNDAQQRVSNAALKDASGDTVGRVTDVDTNERGDVQDVQVSLNDSDNPVSIPAEEVRFDRDGDVLRTDLTWSQIREMANSQNSYDNDDSY